MGKGPNLPDYNTLFQAGIDPKTGLPAKMGSGCKAFLKEGIKKAIRILDEQNAVNRYTWFNLPSGLDGQLLERILYYKGQAMFFYMPTDGKFYFLPYALDGTIDVYGRYTGTTPLPFNGGSTTTESNGKDKILPWIPGLRKTPVYEVFDPENDDITYDIFEDGCVLLHDYTKQISQTVIPRQQIQDPIIDAEAEAFPLARTSLIANSGIRGMRVNDQDCGNQVELASRAMTNAALSGEPLIPIVSQIEIQELTEGNALKSEEFLLYMQSLDNFRLSLYGLENGGLFEKKAHTTDLENSINGGNVNEIMQDGLTIRQKFCDIVNSIWGLGIWCDISETVSSIDMNGDGMVADEQDQSGEEKGEQPMIEGGDE